MVKMIDNYTLLQVIGEGNYGKVYRAKNIKTNQQYAIKIIPSDKLHQNSKLQECTMNEVQTLTTIGQTDHIIMYYQMLKTKNNYYFVYEFCNGGTLMELLGKEHHLDEDKALDIFKQLLEAFKVLNRQNIMHRDLKPENIFFSDNKVKLGDFGFCKGLRPEENLTKTMLGSPIYMAPQVLKGQAYSTKADIWSLGVILYEMLYGVCPFQSSSIAMLINTINSQQITLPSTIKVSQKTQQLLKKLLTKDYFRRMGWIQLFNWFGEQMEGDQIDNVFKATNLNNRSVLEKKASLVEQWATKNKLSEINVKQRSISQDITRKQKTKFDLSSMGNISPTNFRQRTTPFTPKLAEQNDNVGQNAQFAHDFFNEQKSYSVIRQPIESISQFQAYRKPASLPKRQNVQAIQQDIGYGHSSCFKPESNKKIFYSQNYQNIFTTPITQKSSKINDKSIQIAERETSDLQQSTSSNAQVSRSIQNKNKVEQRLSITKNSLVNSRGTGSIIGFKNQKQIKSQNSKLKRKQLLQIHEQCLNVLKQTFKKLQQGKEKYLKVAYLVLTGVLQKLREITRFINIVEIDLLDVSSLINSQIIQVDKMVVDLKEQLDSTMDQLPSNINDLKEMIKGDNEEDRLIKEFLIMKKIHDTQLKNSIMSQHRTATFGQQNVSIVNMLPKQKQEEKEKNDHNLYSSQEHMIASNNSKFSKAQYYTTNQFAQYYKNLVQSKEKNSSSKITMLS